VAAGSADDDGAVVVVVEVDVVLGDEHQSTAEGDSLMSGVGKAENRHIVLFGDIAGGFHQLLAA
jgi:hypothetical protein